MRPVEMLHELHRQLTERRNALARDLAEVDAALAQIAAPPARERAARGPSPHRGLMRDMRAFLIANPGSTTAEIARGIGERPENCGANLLIDMRRGRMRRVAGDHGFWRWWLITAEEHVLDGANLLDPLWSAKHDAFVAKYREARDAAHMFEKRAEAAE